MGGRIKKLKSKDIDKILNKINASQEDNNKFLLAHTMAHKASKLGLKTVYGVKVGKHTMDLLFLSKKPNISIPVYIGRGLSSEGTKKINSMKQALSFMKEVKSRIKEGYYDYI